MCVDYGKNALLVLKSHYLKLLLISFGNRWHFFAHNELQMQYFSLNLPVKLPPKRTERILFKYSKKVNTNKKKKKTR